MSKKNNIKFMDAKGRPATSFNGAALYDQLGNPVHPVNDNGVESAPAIWPGKTLTEKFAEVTSAGSSRDHKPINQSPFTKFHLAISRQEWDRQRREVMRPTLRSKVGDPNIDNKGYLSIHDDHKDLPLMEISRIENPSYRGFMKRLEAVGGEFGWHKRKKYQNQELIEHMLSRPDTAMLAFVVDGQEVGFTIITGIQKNPPRSFSPDGAMSKGDAIRRFAEYENDRIINEDLDYRPLPQNPTVLEIYKFGMYQGSTSGGLGHYFLPAVMEKIFNGDLFPDQDGPQMIYLDTRDTNPRGTLTFYLRNGLAIFEEEQLENDLNFNVSSFGPVSEVEPGPEDHESGSQTLDTNAGDKNHPEQLPLAPLAPPPEGPA